MQAVTQATASEESASIDYPTTHRAPTPISMPPPLPLCHMAAVSVQRLQQHTCGSRPMAQSLAVLAARATSHGRSRRQLHARCRGDTPPACQNTLHRVDRRPAPLVASSASASASETAPHLTRHSSMHLLVLLQVGWHKSPPDCKASWTDCERSRVLRPCHAMPVNRKARTELAIQ